MSENVILNVAVGGRYPAGQQRLLGSLDILGDHASRLFWDRWPGLSHEVVPYGFKVDAFDWAFWCGCRRALWLDAQVIARHQLAPVWAWVQRHSVLLLEDRAWNLGEWTSDAALEIFGIGRDAAMGLPLCWAKVIGIDLSSLRGREFLERWRDLADSGAFNGVWNARDYGGSIDPRWRGHRHDQSCASWLAHDMGIPMAPMDDFLSTKPTAKTIFLVQDL